MNEQGHPLYDEDDLHVLDMIGSVIIAVIVVLFLLYLGYHVLRWWLSAF